MTKDTEKAFVILYSEYLRRRSFGTAMQQAVWFEDAKIKKIDAFSSWNPQDISYCLRELGRLGFVKIDILGDVEIQEQGIMYMEQKPKEYFSTFTGVVRGLIDLISAFRIV